MRTKIKFYKDKLAVNFLAKDKENGKEFMKYLREGEVEIHVRKHYANLGIVNVDMRALTDDDVKYIAKRVKEILK